MKNFQIFMAVLAVVFAGAACENYRTIYTVDAAAKDEPFVAPSEGAASSSDDQTQALQDQIKTLQEQLENLPLQESVDGFDNPNSDKPIQEAGLIPQVEEEEETDERRSVPFFTGTPIAAFPTPQTPPTVLWTQLHPALQGLYVQFSEEVDVNAIVENDSIEVIGKAKPTITPYLAPGGVLIGFGGLGIQAGETLEVRILGADLSADRAVQDLQGNRMADTESYTAW